MAIETLTIKTYETLESPGFKAVCRLGFINAAIAIIYEADTTPNHEKRLNLAGKILRGDISSVIMANAVMRDEALQVKVEANDLTFYLDILNVVTGVYNAIAEAYAI